MSEEMELTAEDLVDAALCWLHDESLEYFLEGQNWADDERSAWLVEHKGQVEAFAERVQAIIELAAREEASHDMGRRPQRGLRAS